jgi:predicted DNA-binding protein
MSVASHYETIALEALSLSGPNRRDLVSRLLRSLEEDKIDDSENLAIAEERLRKIRSGEMSTIPYEEVKEAVRAKHGI